MNETTAGVEAGLDYYNFTNGSSLWFDNSTALSEEERIIQQKLNSSFGAWLVFMEMSLALLGIILNLTVLISIREKEAIFNQTANVIHANLCAANLIAAVFVKSFAAVYHGYGVACQRWEIELAFCTVHTITSRSTWVVFPYTLLFLCWHSLALRAGKIVSLIKEKKKQLVTADAPKGFMLGSTAMGMELPLSRSTTVTDEEPMCSFEEESEGLTTKQKLAVGFIWLVAGIYSVMSNSILSKEREVFCSLRSDLSDKFNFMSLFIAIGVPLVFGPMLCPIGHTLLSFIACCKGVSSSTCTWSDPKSQGLSDCAVITGFTVVFIVIYPVQMYVTEVYIANVQSMFVFMAFKYCYGALHIVLLPLIVLVMKKDIRRAAVNTYVKGKEDDSGEITFEQFQKETGMGVNPG